MTPRIVFTPSASKHGFSDRDIMWAMSHAFVTEPTQDQLHPEWKATRYIGPAEPPSTRRLEVVASIDEEHATLVIFHAMEMRPKFQHLLDQQWGK